MKRAYSEIMDDVQKAKYGKESRKLHKELKKYYHDGLPLFMRYPFLPTVLSAISIAISVFTLILLSQIL